MSGIDWVILGIYFTIVLGVGAALRRFTRTSTDFFLAGRALPAWVCGLAFISANLGAQEVIGMAASGAKYGVATGHFYWIGAVPAMVFVGLFMMPFSYGSRARSVPEYLRLRFDEKTRAFNALSFAAMTVFSSGISMYAMAKLIVALRLFDTPVTQLGLPASSVFDLGILVSAVVVLVYIFLGGLTSAIYNEVLQFFLIVAGLLPLVALGVADVGGVSGLTARLDPALTHAWNGFGASSTNRMGVEWFGLVMGLGFVLSFGYWCTDFLVVQRAMAAHSMTAARRTPLIAAFPKMLFPALVILPGLLALAATAVHHGLTLPNGAAVGVKGGWFGVMHEYSSEMAQNFWTAIYAWTACFVTMISVSLSTRPRVASELTGLVYSLTPKPVTEPLAWYARPAVLATTALATTIVINVLLW